MRFFFTYGSDEHYPFQCGWTEIEAPSYALACAIFREYHPDRDPETPCLNCADVYTEAEFGDTIEWVGANFRDRCHERITLARELLDSGASAEQEQPLTLAELVALPDGEPVWVADKWVPAESGYHFIQRFNGYTLLISPHDFPSKDGCVPHWGTDGQDEGGYGQAWTAYRRKPDKAWNKGSSDVGG